MGEALIEELRVGSYESKGAAQSLTERLTALRKAVEMQKPGAISDGSLAPSSPMSPPRAVSRERGGSPRGSPKGSDIESPLAKAIGDSVGGFTELGPDSPGVSTSMPSELSMTAPTLPAGARDSEDPLIRKAAEESDLLHKRVLALEDERAQLI